MTNDLFRVVDCTDDCEKVCNLRIAFDTKEVTSIVESISRRSNLSKEEVAEELIDLLLRSVHQSLDAKHEYWSRDRTDA